MPTAFRVSWDRVMCGKILKYDEDPDCEDCGVPIPDGKQYGCEYCGNDFCEECMEQEADGMGFSGYRGEIDSGHPLEKHPEFTGGAYCPSCAVNMMANYGFDYNMESGEYEMPPEEEDEGEFEPFPLNPRSNRPANPLANVSAEALIEMTDPADGNQRTIQMAVQEIQRRMEEGSVEERTKLGAMTENQLNTMGQKLGRNPMIAVPPSMADREFGFPGDFTDKFASADAFTSVWDVIKRERI